MAVRGESPAEGKNRASEQDGRGTTERARDDGRRRAASDGAASRCGGAAGVFTMILLRSLEERLSVDELQQLLQRAGVTGTVAEFKEVAASSSIDQFTRLRHEADRVLGVGPNRRR
jgi:hypothetical protein